VLACLHALDEDEREEFFNRDLDDLQRLTPAELMYGKSARNVDLSEVQSALLRRDLPERLDLVTSAATAFRNLVFRQLEAMVGAAGGREKRQMLRIWRMAEHLRDRSLPVLEKLNDPRAREAMNALHLYMESLESQIAKAQQEPDRSVHFN